MDLESKGCAFTWTNNRSGDQFVKERLGRGLCNLDWRISYPNAESIALPAIGSDHSPIIISLHAWQNKKRKTFRYEAFWAEDEESRLLVKQIWAEGESQGPNLAQKLQMVAKQLTQWSRHGFHNAKQKIDELKNVLRRLSNGKGVHDEAETAKGINREIEKLWRQEEMFWGMRSRIN